MKNRMLRTAGPVLVLAALLLAAVLRLDSLLAAAAVLLRILRPLLWGGLLAFVLNVPVRRVEKLLTRLDQRYITRARPCARHTALSLLLTLLCILAIAAGVCVWALPALVDSAGAAAAAIGQLLPTGAKLLRESGAPFLRAVADRFDAADLPKLLEQFMAQQFFIKGGAGTGFVPGSTATAGNLANGAMEAAAVTAHAALDALLAVVIALYLILGKRRLARQCLHLARAWLPGHTASALCRVWALTCNVFDRFFTGQFIEACILGALMFAAFGLFRLPYAGVIALLTAVSAFIPYLGAFFSCAAGVVLILTVSPGKALTAFVVYQTVQFVENQCIYPRVVGRAVGLPPLLTLLAALAGARLAGVLGMIFSIPLAAVLYALLRRATQRRLRAQKVHPRG